MTVPIRERARPAHVRGEDVIVERRKPVVAQVAPAHTTNVDLYTCPKGKYAVVRVLAVTVAAGAGQARIALRKAGAALANQHYVAFDVLPTAAVPYVTPMDVHMDGGDVLTVYYNNAGTSAVIIFQALGYEHPYP